MALSARFDYLQGTCYFDSESDVNSFLDDVCGLLPIGDSWYFRGHSLFLGEFFNYSFSSIRGKLFGGINYSKLDAKYKVLLQIPGTYCSLLSAADFLFLCQFLRHNSFNFTRCDIAIDDYSRRISFDEVDRVGESGNYRLVRSYQQIKSKIVRSCPAVSTCYFGRGYKKLRFYNAEVVHGIEADRWELQLGYRHAQSVVSDFMEDQNCLSDFLFGSVDFGEETADYWSSFRRFDWWQSLIDEGASPRKVKLTYFEPCFQRSLDWLYSQVAPTLAVASHGYGDQFDQLISDLVNSGSSRFKDYHHKLISEIKKENSIHVI